MAIAINYLGGSAGDVSEVSVTSGNFTPSNDALLAVVVGMRDGTAVGTSNNISADTVTNNGAWVGYHGDNVAATFNRRVAVFFSQISGSGGTNVNVTIDFNGVNIGEFNVEVFEITGHNTAAGTGAITQSKSGSKSAGSTGLVILDVSPGASSATFGAIYQEGGGSITPGSGFTEMFDTVGASSNDLLQSQYNLTPSDGAIDWSGLNNSGASMLGFEVEPPGSGAAGGAILLSGL